MMTLAVFLETYFNALKDRGLSICVPRNHRGFPDLNVGNDLDLLVQREDVSSALDVLRSIPGIALTSLAQRSYVVHVCIHGIDASCMSIDLISSLTWRGLDFVRVSDVLRRVTRHPSCAWIPIADPVDEAMISFFSSYLPGGFIKARYAPDFIPVFRSASSEVEARLKERMSLGVLRPLVNAVANNQHEAAMTYLGPLRRSLMSLAARRQPTATLRSVLQYFASEVRIHFTPSNMWTVAIIGPDGAGKSAVIEAVAVRLKDCSKILEKRHLRPRLPGGDRTNTAEGPVLDPHGKPLKSRAASVAQLAMWLAAYWLDRLVHRKRNSTLRIYDRYFHDVLVDPRRYRYGGPRWFAIIMSRLVPQPNLVLVLDAPEDVLQARKQEVTLAETARQRGAYLDLARAMPNTHVVDASRPLDDVVAEVEQIVLDRMAARTARQMGLSNS